jgi:indolepyruvate ferredoxin oxidoreductase beta subunit
MSVKSVMIVGVGGQGSLLASRLLGNLLTEEGYDVKVSEVHGMSQRGGSVVTYVRYGEKVYSPIVTEGECDYIISFEKLEAARYAGCLRKGGKIIVNTQEIDPMPVITGASAYPEKLIEKLEEKGAQVDAMDCLTLAEEAGLLRDEMNGAQDYDFIFRCAEKAETIVRIPEILYHWRTSETSTADNPMSKQYAYEAGARAIRENLERAGTEGTVEALPDFGFYRVRYPVSGSPLVSVIIPNKDHADMLKKCVESVFANDYQNVEIIIVENNSTERETFAYYRELSRDPRVRLFRWKHGFNYSAINNYGVRYAKGEYLLFLNNDVRGDISSDWLTEMLGVCQRKDVGAVGARLYYPNNRIQHAGIVIGIGGVAGAMFVDLPKGRGGYMHKAAIMQDLSAVTAACMLVKREAFEKAGGFTKELAVAFNDVDLCLKIGKNGYRIVYDPFAELYHDESRTRGAEDTPEKVKRFQSEIEYMRVHWLDIIKNGDPNYNPNLSLKKWNYSLRV